MAIYQGGKGMAFQGGGNSMFDQLNQAQQRVSELKQVQKEEAFLDKVNQTGQLGKIDSDFYTSDGKFNLGNFKSWKDHYKDITQDKSSTELKKTFGKNVSPQIIEDVLKKKTDERDMAVLNAIKRRMAELGTNNIYKVVDKNDASFKSWYDSILQPERRQELLGKEFNYTPGQKEERFIPDWLEKRRAQRKSSTGLGTGAVLAGAGGVYAGSQALSMLKANNVGQYREMLSGDKGKKLRDLKGTNKSIVEQQQKLSTERATNEKKIQKLQSKKKLKKSDRKNIKALQDRIKTIDNEKNRLAHDKGRFKRGGQAQISKERSLLNKAFRDSKTKGYLSQAKNLGGGLASSIGGSQLGGAIGEYLGDDAGRTVGEITGGSLPWLAGTKVAKKAAKFLLPKALQRFGMAGMSSGGGFLPGAVALGAGTLLDLYLND
jgi:hypothetical protein